MRVLVIGSGGREHALVWKLAQSRRVSKVFCTPGNPGTAKLAENLPVQAENIVGLLHVARQNRIDLTVVGPEDPLSMGIVDRFRERGFTVFGPTRRAARLESSKVFTRKLCRQHAIPSPEFGTFTDPEAARKYIRENGVPAVVKADGLAKGKGVYVCHTLDEANAAIDDIMVKKVFGEAGDEVVIEEFLKGEEASLLAFTDGRNIYPMESAQDHKPVHDGDKGPNTGGMGAYSPAPAVTPELLTLVEREILVPTVHAMNTEECPYSGVLYAGLMITRNGPKVLEFNVRFGDPETQPILMRLKSDLSEVLEAVTRGELDKVSLEWDSRPAVCVVMASGGYPGSYAKGKEITGIDEAAGMKDVVVFHAGTAEKDGRVYTAGGRVLGVTALGDTIKSARERAYEAVKLIHFEGAHCRRDIGAKAIQRE
jgi:phosphoribosylamine--glycine ligase